MIQERFGTLGHAMQLDLSSENPEGIILLQAGGAFPAAHGKITLKGGFQRFVETWEQGEPMRKWMSTMVPR